MRSLLTLSILATALFCGFISTPADTGYHVGDVVKNFSLLNVNGKMVSLGDYPNAKGYIVTFTCNHCPFAKLYESRIMDLDKQFAAKGYPVIAISPNDPGAVPEDSPENMKALAKEKGYSFPYLFDQSQDVAHAFGATNTPHVDVIAKENDAYIVKYVGAIDDNPQDAKAAKKHFVADAVNALLTGKTVAVTQTKAIGCSIKWKNS